MVVSVLMEDCSAGVRVRWRTVVVVSVSDGGLQWWCLC